MKDILPSIVGDGSWNGWATFLAYCGTAFLCWQNVRISRRQAERGGKSGAQARARRRFWIVALALTALLGLTRQFDLQAMAAQTARNIFSAEGLYEQRSGFQIALVTTVGIFGGLGLLGALLTLRRADGSILAGAAGVGLLVTFTLIRAVSLHGIDRLLRRGVPHFQINNLIELGALAVIAAASIAFGRRMRAEEESARLRGLADQERRKRLAARREHPGT